MLCVVSLRFRRKSLCSHFVAQWRCAEKLKDTDSVLKKRAACRDILSRRRLGIEKQPDGNHKEARSGAISTRRVPGDSAHH